MDGYDFYLTHAKDCEEFGLPVLPHWDDLTPEQRAGWDEAADEFIQKRLADYERTNT